MMQKHIIEELVNEGCLIDKNAFREIKEEDLDYIKNLKVKPMIIDIEFLQNLRKRYEKVIVLEKKEEIETSLEIDEYEGEERKRDVEDFHSCFLDRFERIKKMLLKRQELKNSLSISNLKESNESISIIGVVRDKIKTKNNKYFLILEDTTGEIKVLVNENYGDYVVLDDVIGIVGKFSKNIVFAEEIIWPDIPLNTEVKKTEEEVYCAFLSDLHFGSKYLLIKKVIKFLKWIKSNDYFASKVGYILITGDLVDGVGKYPGQSKSLVQNDIYKQYESLCNFLSEIPERIKVILIPGDHDVVRMAEPQPKIPSEFVKDVSSYNNIFFTSNPVKLKIHVHDNPINVLLYHGYSYHRHVDSIPPLRKKSENRPTEVLKDLLRRRHLSPTYGNVQLYPEDRDYLVIDEVPDIFAIGHLHLLDYSNYKGTNVICSTTFQGVTDFMKRIGWSADPGKLILLNLKTRQSVLKLF